VILSVGNVKALAVFRTKGVRRVSTERAVSWRGYRCLRHGSSIIPSPFLKRSKGPEAPSLPDLATRLASRVVESGGFSADGNSGPLFDDEADPKMGKSSSEWKCGSIDAGVTGGALRDPHLCSQSPGTPAFD
jgi:hypothetical protein